MKFHEVAIHPSFLLLLSLLSLILYSLLCYFAVSNFFFLLFRNRNPETDTCCSLFQ